MFRTVAFFNENGDPVEAVSLRSAAFPTEQEADAFLARLTALPCFTGGDVEANVPGIGWVTMDQAESAVLIRNRREQDDYMLGTDRSCGREK